METRQFRKKKNQTKKTLAKNKKKLQKVEAKQYPDQKPGKSQLTHSKAEQQAVF